jgi:hypothetical protein
MQLRNVLKKTLKVLGYGFVFVLVVLTAAHLIWKYSGTGEWELEIDKKEVKVYSRKVAGSTLKEFKAQRRIKTTVARAAAAMRSTDIEDCSAWIPGCESGKVIENWNPKGHYFIHFYHVNYPGPVEPREFLLKTEFTKTAQNGLQVDFRALPDLMPQSGCCYRISKMHNTWRYTPVNAEEVDVELHTRMDHGLPYPLINKGAPSGLYSLFRALPRLINKEKFEKSTFYAQL